MNQYFVFWWTDSHEPKSAVIMAEDNLAAEKITQGAFNVFCPISEQPMNEALDLLFAKYGKSS